MPAMDFQPQFAALVEGFVKRQTIRRVRKYPIKVGDNLIFYTRLRKPDCRKLGEAICTDVIPVKMGIRVDPLMPSEGARYFVELNGMFLGAKGRQELAEADGFSGVVEMIDWFLKRYIVTHKSRQVFDGAVLLKW